MQRLISRSRAALERPWSDRLAALERDLAMLLGRPEPARQSPRRPPARPASAPDAIGSPPAFERGRELRVSDVVRATPDAVMLVLEPRLERWRAGQFLTVTVAVDGRRYRRAYSLCTRPEDPRGPAIVIKRVPEGRVSNHLVANAVAGMTVEVRGPSGHFVLPDGDASNHVVLVGGGSGITPLVALAEEVIARGARATLVYGNRTLGDVIFRQRLAELEAAAGGRFVLRHLLESPPPDWQGGVGRLDRGTAERELAPLVGAADRLFSCGPAAMMDAVRDAFLALGGARDRLHEERFQSLAAVRPSALPTTAQPLRIAIAGQLNEVLARPGATLLEAGLAAGLTMPYSCTMGGCGACRVRVRGEVVHDMPNGLSSDEAAAGYAFACIARPLGPCSVEVPS